MASQRAPRKRQSKADRELKEAAETAAKLEKSAERQSVGRTRLADLRFARLMHEGWEKTEAYVDCYQPSTSNRDSLNTMASRMAKNVTVRRELDRLRREEENEANQTDQLELLLMDGPRMKLEVLKTIYTLATSPEVPDNVRLQAAIKLGDMRHVDAFAKASTTFNVDNSKTQNNLLMANMDTNDAGELRAALKSTISGLLDAPASPLHAKQPVIDIVPEKA